MSTPNPLRRRFLQVLGTTLAAWRLGSPAHAQQAAGATPEQIRIGYQKSAVNLVILKQTGALDKRFPGSKVSWVEFPAGPQLLEALALGSLEFGMTGDTPPVFAQAAGKDLVYAGAEPPKPDSSAILVPNTSPLRKLSDLKGKRVALQKGSSAHYLLLRAVEKAGLQWNEIEPIYLAPAEARAAFERGSVDAWAIWDPYYATTELALQPRVLANGVGLSNNNSFYLASRQLATQHPQVIAALLQELGRAAAYARDKRPDTIALLAKLTGLDNATVGLFLQRRPYSPVQPLDATLTADQQRVADAFHAQGLLPRAVRVADIVWQHI